MIVEEIFGKVVDVSKYNSWTVKNPPTVRDQFGGLFIYVGF